MRIDQKTVPTIKQSGFTLVEVIVAISILTIGILAVASMQVSAIRGNSFAAGATEGATWCGDRLERLVELPWGDPLLQDADGDGAAGLDDTGFDNDPGTQADADFQTTEGQYTIHWNVADNVVTSNTRTITVIVTWTDHGAQRRASMQRVIPRII